MSTIKRKIYSLCIVLVFLLTACGSTKGARLKEYLDLGQKYITEMKYEAAIIVYSKVIEIDPKNVKAYQALADVYESRGDMEEAKSTLERALIAVPSNEEVQSRYERLEQMTTAGASSDSSAEATEGAPEEAPEGAPAEPPTEASIKADGWVQMNGKWYFFVGGEKAAGWMQQGENWFYFDEDGVLQHGKTKIGNDWYFFNEDGAMVTGWQEENGKWYYFGPDGKMLTDRWIEDTFYVGADGAMLVSTTTPDGEEVDAEGKRTVSITKRNEAYRKVISGLEAEYGEVRIHHEKDPEGRGFDNYGVIGLCYLDLLDFNNDDNPELLTIYHDGPPRTGFFYEEEAKYYKVRIYEYYKGEAHAVYEGSTIYQVSGEGGINYAIIKEDGNGRLYWVEGYNDEGSNNDYQLYTIENHQAYMALTEKGYKDLKLPEKYFILLGECYPGDFQDHWKTSYDEIMNKTLQTKRELGF